MKNILGHKSWNFEEVVYILTKGGVFCMCRLPHYRFRPVQGHCARLRKAGLIQKTGATDTGINYKATALFRRWKVERELGITDLGVIKWAKIK